LEDPCIEFRSRVETMNMGLEVDPIHAL
jgi:hypothetical protein